MRCAARVAEDDPPGAYVCIWASSGVLPHGSKLLTPTSTVPPIPFLPWGLKDQLLRVARNLWQQRGPFLGIYVPISAVVVKRLSEKLWKDIHEIGGAVSYAKVGILRGGGIAHATYASAIRAVSDQTIPGKKPPKKCGEASSSKENQSTLGAKNAKALMAKLAELDDAEDGQMEDVVLQ